VATRLPDGTSRHEPAVCDVIHCCNYIFQFLTQVELSNRPKKGVMSGWFTRTKAPGRDERSVWPITRRYRHCSASGGASSWPPQRLPFSALISARLLRSAAGITGSRGLALRQAK
jgi:hypothetical protein